MTEAGQPQSLASLETKQEAGLSLEVVILLVFGIFMLLFGANLPQIHAGTLPYSPDGTYGLFLVLTSFQVVTLGKTPFGDLRRSWSVVLAGIAVALLGMTCCFTPGRLSEPVRLLVGIVLAAGGTSLFLQLVFSRQKARQWLRWRGLPRHLTIACGLVYLLSVILGLVTLWPGAVSGSITAILLLVDAASLFYLAWAIQAINRTPPPGDGALRPGEPSRSPDGAFLPASLAILIIMAVLLAYLGAVLIPVHLGWLPFSPDGLQGLLLTVFALQAMALGDTPVGRFRRSWLLMAFGTAAVALGAFSCIVPGVLTNLLRYFLAVLNLAAGAIFFAHRLRQKNQERTVRPSGELPPIVARIRSTQTVLNIVVIAFGIHMLVPVPGQVPSLVSAAIIMANGILLFRLAFLLRQLG